MIQILGLRKWTPQGQTEEKIYDAFHDKNWRADSVKELFENCSDFLKQIPDDEKWNLFYTINNCTDQKRDFASCATIAFDIDGGRDKKTGRDKGEVKQDRWLEYAECIASVMKCKAEDLAVVNSGNGLHFLFQLAAPPIKDRDFFKKNKHHFAAISSKITLKLKEKDLGGEPDPAIFHHRSLLRLPGTENRKPNKESKPCFLIKANIKRLKFNFKELSGLPDVSKNDQIPKEIMAKYPTVDSKAIKEGCDFLKWCKKSANEVSEPLWYAALSIAGRMDDGLEFAHEISRGYVGYDAAETDVKFEQSIAASGPRTCKNIQGLGYEGCGGCKFKDEVESPISIVSEGHIKTAHMGFHSFIPGKGLRPNFDDLRQHFDNKFKYKGLESSKNVYTYVKTHYEECGHNAVESFAEAHFFPKPKTSMTKEFLNKVVRTNLMYKDFWNESSERKINFQNGFLDINTNEFLPHSSDIGFRYVLPYKYDTEAKAPIFQSMLDRLTCGDKDMQKVLLEFMGYSLSSDDCWAQKALVLVGEGANGKSTFINVLRNLGGIGNYSSASLKDLQKSEYSRQLLDGKLFNVSEETPTSAMMDTSLFKDVVAGGELQVRQIYKDAYFMRNRAKFIFSCNELPEACDTSYGYYRRLVIVPFNATFSRADKAYDPHIDKKLVHELPGIFNLALWGYHSLCRNGGFTDASKVAETIDVYKKETDTVFSWFEDNTKIKDQDHESFACLSDIYMNYKISTEAQGIRPVSRGKFTRDIKKRVVDWETRYGTKRMQDTGAVKRGLKGIEFGEGIGISL